MERVLKAAFGDIIYDDEVFEENSFRLRYRSTYSGKRIPMPKGLRTCAKLFEDTFILAGSYLDGWDTSGITDFSYMFHKCTMPSDFNLDALNMQNAIFCNYMFQEAILPKDVKLSAPKVSGVEGMFQQCDASNGLELTENFCTKNVMSFNGMFSHMKMPANFKLPNSFDTSNARSMSSMFTDTKLPEGFSFGENFDTSKVEYMESMFSRTVAPPSFKFPSKWNMENVTEASNMFHKSVGVLNETCGLENGFSTKKVVRMSSMFHSVVFPKNTKFLEKLSMDSVKDATYCFEGITAPEGFRLPEGLNVSGVTDMTYMFAHARFADDFKLPASFEIPGFCKVRNMFSDISVKGVAYSTAPNEMIKNLQREADSVTTDQRIAYIVQAIDEFGESMEWITARQLVCDYFRNVVERKVPCGSDIKVFVDERYSDGVRIRLKTVHNTLTVQRSILDKDLDLDNWLLQHATYLRATAKVDYTKVLDIAPAALANCTTEAQFIELVRKYVY